MLRNESLQPWKRVGEKKKQEINTKISRQVFKEWVQTHTMHGLMLHTFHFKVYETCQPNTNTDLFQNIQKCHWDEEVGQELGC